MKKSVFISVVFVLLLTALLFAGCTTYSGKVIEDPDAVISNVKQISVSEYTNQYFLGQPLDYTKFTLRLLLDTGEIKTIPVTENSKTVSVSGYNRFQVGEQTITVKYGGKMSVSYKVTVIEPTIQSIRLKSLPQKTSYVQGDRLDMTGAVISILQDNGQSIEFSVTNDIVTSGYLLEPNKEFNDTTGDNIELFINYGSQRLSFFVKVSPKKLTGIEVVTLPQKTEYYIGDAVIDASGLVLKYSYDNNTSKEDVDATTQTSNLRYSFDFGASDNNSVVTVQYFEGEEVLASATFTVVVRAAAFQRIEIVTKPLGIDQLIEGFSIIDYQGGTVKITFEDGASETLSMTDERIKKSDYNNKIIGEQTIKITYRYNEVSVAELKVYTNEKQVESIELFGESEVTSQTYYEGQLADISVAKLYYSLHYNNKTVSERKEVTAELLAEGRTLSCVSDSGTPGRKQLVFSIAGKTVSITVSLIPKAVKNIEIIDYPANRYLSLSGSPVAAGGSISVLYNNQTMETLSMDDPSRVTLVYDLSGVSVGAEAEVKVYCGEASETNPYAAYTVTVSPFAVTAIRLNETNLKKQYSYGQDVTFGTTAIENGVPVFKGMEFTVTVGGTDYAAKVTAEKVVDGVSTVAVDCGETLGTVEISKTALLGGKSIKMTQSGAVQIDFYGAKASYNVNVAERIVNGVNIHSTQNVALQLFVGQTYPTVRGLSVKITYSDSSYDIVTLTDSAARVASLDEILSEGWYWYTVGNTSEAGLLTVYAAYAKRNEQSELNVYTANYAVHCVAAEMVRIEGVYKLTSAGYEVSADLGKQAKGLTPYLNDYYLAVLYSDDNVRYVNISVSMTDYEIKNHTIGSRIVNITFNGATVQSKIYVDAAEITSVTLGTTPKNKYVYSENLSLDGGTLVRSFNVESGSGLTRQDNVDMKEAEVSYPERAWPKSEEAFQGAAFLTVTVRLTYENFTVDFPVTVYPKQDISLRVTNLTSYYAHVTPPSVSFNSSIEGFAFPNYVQTYEYADGTPFVGAGNPTVVNGNVVYPAPYVVGKYYVVIKTDGNRYFKAAEDRQEMQIEKLHVNLTPNTVGKIYGDNDPTLTFTTEDQEAWNEVTHLLLCGNLVRAVGENVGEYAIFNDPSNSFEDDNAHPYFTITVVNAGVLRIDPRVFEVEVQDKTLYYKIDDNGDAIDQLNDIRYLYNFVTYVGGVKTVITEDLWRDESNPNAAACLAWFQELQSYSFTISTRKVGAAEWVVNGAIAEKDKYEIQLEYKKQDLTAGAQQNLMFYGKLSGSDREGYLFAQTVTVTVEAAPWGIPEIQSGGNVLRLPEFTATDDMNALEAEVLRVGGSYDYDFVITVNFVFVWKYRPSQWSTYPEAKWLIYQTSVTGTSWLGVDAAGQSFTGYRIRIEDVFASGSSSAVIVFKFKGNGIDKADSAGEATVILSRF